MLSAPFKPHLLLGLFLMFANLPILGQTTLDQQDQKQTIEAISELLDQYYVYPSVAHKMKTYLRESYKLGKYGGFTHPASFAQRLTLDLQRISRDKHLRVFYDPEGIRRKQESRMDGNSLGQDKYALQGELDDNFGFGKKEILAGNLGYIELTRFSGFKEAETIAHNTMDFFKDVDALIIDLRNNRGGSTRMIQLLSSYFFDSQPRHLNSFYWRSTGNTTEVWTLNKLPGKRFPDLPVYILTSNKTFSAAEEFAYNLKYLNRATIIGQVTAGGAHPGGEIVVTQLFMIWLPQGRAINPITGSNWEGTGVAPHVVTDPDLALQKAIFMARMNLSQK